MLAAAQNAIITALRSVFPVEEVSTIYLTEVPADFERPSFFLHMILPFRGEDITTHIRRYPMSWQVVYFPPLDAAGNEDSQNLMDMAMSLEELFGQERTLTLTGMPGGNAVAQIDGFTYDTRDGVGYGSLQFTVFLRREDADAVPLQKVELDFGPI